jgi:hypothetical protein
MENKPNLEKWQKRAIGGGFATATAIIVILVICIGITNSSRTIENDTTLYLTSDLDYWDFIGATLERGQTYRADWTATRTVNVYALTDTQLQYLYTYGYVGSYECFIQTSDGWMEYAAYAYGNIVFVFVSGSYAVVTIHTTIYL